jgi:hypothetical protein
MREAIYPVPQPGVTTPPPSLLLFRLPPTLPVTKPLQGKPQDPIIVGPPRIIKVPIAEIVSRDVIKGIARGPFFVFPSQIIIVPNAEIVTRVITQGILQQVNIEGLSKLLKFVVPGVVPTPPVFSLHGVTQSIPDIAPSELLKITFADSPPVFGLRGIPLFIPDIPASKLLQIIIPVTPSGPPVFSLHGVSLNVLDISISKLSQILLPIVPSTPPVFSLHGVTQPDIIVSPSELLNPPILDIVSKIIIRGLPQDVFAANPPQLLQITITQALQDFPSIWAITGQLKSDIVDVRANPRMIIPITATPGTAFQVQRRRRWHRSTSG